MARALLAIIIRLAESLKDSELAASPTNFNSANYERLVGYSSSADKTRGRGANDRPQKTQQYFTVELAVE